MGKEIKLGSGVKDVLTGASGIVIAKTQWLYGCQRVIVQPCEKKESQPADYFVVDESYVERSKCVKVARVPEIEVDLNDSFVHLGDRVRDKISGLTGVVVAKTLWLQGGMRITVQPEGTFEGKPLASQTFDEPQLTVTEESVFEFLPADPSELVERADTGQRSTVTTAQEATTSSTYGDDLPGPSRHPDPVR